MQNFKSLGEELEKSGKAEGLRRLASSEEGQRLSRMLDMEQLQKAAEGGDTAQMQNIVKSVLRTQEGRSLAESLMKLMQD